MPTLRTHLLRDTIGEADPAAGTTIDEHTRLELVADAGDDLFAEPGTSGLLARLRVEGAWIADAEFQLSARLRVGFQATFDSAVILGWFAPDLWFKICAERDPQGRTRVVSVVTRDRSDDANGAFFRGDAVHVRVSRRGDVFALHSSADGVEWDLVRLFEMVPSSPGPVFVGFAAQSPTGAGTTATVDRIAYADRPLEDVRAG